MCRTLIIAYMGQKILLYPYAKARTVMISNFHLSEVLKVDFIVTSKADGSVGVFVCHKVK